mmetsp:Transcript_75581/g.130827  ORF Transcript_75581/g.130827 Transcript_75581/m.130827 type:complete len:268 (+) Transcript_75581:55-858(+)
MSAQMMLPKDEPVYVNLSKSLERDAPTLHSRSTSAGTTPPPSPEVPMASPGARRGMHMPYPLGPNMAGRDLPGTDVVPGLPELEYPVQFPVQGTFIHYPAPRSSSLEDFYKERQFSSEPPMIAPPPGLESYADAQAQASRLKLSASGALSVAANAMAFAAASAAALKSLTKPPSAPPTPSNPTRPHQISLLDALQETKETGPKLGSPEMPTVGSADHASGACKPCAFFHTKGCGNGVQCSFCHLCEPGEKKRRQKEKAAASRNTKRA